MKTAIELKKYQRRMLANPTPAERIIAEKLQTAGFDFKQQMILGFYILDFVIPKKMLVIEVDGKNHEERKQIEYDVKKDNFIKECGFSILRIRNEYAEGFDIEVIKNMKNRTTKEFRSSLGKANALRSKAIQKTKKRLSPEGDDFQKLKKLLEKDIPNTIIQLIEQYVEVCEALTGKKFIKK